ncbi:peptidase M23 [Capnocytophaga stomatis]|uniref:Peptidase M23 n=1 Tax=Capnocytophaga stomatis TaxID=1848904 RepID=A0A250FWY4_9FLAO|nr:peptidoglycan DD-metalloendopeptidase family protein [Capnocytophaga stomatis]ATA89662.1 peptidase M23 [Capnocytophaga stomatis]
MLLKEDFKKGVFFLLATPLFWSCDGLITKLKEEKKEEKEKTVVVEEPKKEPVFEFGFNLDEYNIVKDTVKSGDTFGKILASNNVGASEIHEISTKMKEVLDSRMLRAGKAYALLFDKKNPSKPHSFVYQPSLTEYVVVKMSDSIYAYSEQRKITIVEREKAGFIKNSLIESALDVGMSYNVAFNLSQIFDYTIDFFHLQEGDNFKIIYEERYVDDTIYAGVANVKAAYFEHKGKPYYAFNYVTDSVSGKKGFYDEKGNTMKRMFLKAPLEIFRITSRFGMRYHPVLHRMKNHFGTDYAAPHGTPIRATAAGTVIEAGYNGGNGNYVKIKHNATYTTQYLHMSKILVKKGQHVPQGHIIGKVGSTGLATGPHVCYRFWKNGKQVDPLKEKMPESIPIDEKLKERYLQDIASVKQQLDALKAVPIEEETQEKENEIDLKVEQQTLSQL